jgi:hypothetical protein
VFPSSHSSPAATFVVSPQIRGALTAMQMPVGHEFRQ